MLSKEKRLEELQEFIPNAKCEDWDLVVAANVYKFSKNKCFPQHMNEWEPKIKEMTPSYGVSPHGKSRASARHLYVNSRDAWAGRKGASL